MQINKDTLFADSTGLDTLGFIAVLLCGMTPGQVEALAKKPNPSNGNKGTVEFMKLRAAIAKKLQEGAHGAAYTGGTLEVETPAEKQAQAEKAQAEKAQAEKAQAEKTQQHGPWAEAEAEEAAATGSTGPKAEPNAQAKAKAKRAPKGNAVPSKGAYTLGKPYRGTFNTAAHPDRWTVWQHIWECNTFEEYFAKVGTDSVEATSTLRAKKKPTVKLNAYQEMAYAIKQGWIVPLAA